MEAWPVNLLKRDIQKAATFAVGAVLAVGAGIGIAVDLLVRHLLDEGISDHRRDR